VGIPIVGQTLSQWGDAIDAWTVWITYTCFKMSWYVLYQHPRWNQVLYECVSQAIWSSMRGYNIYNYIYMYILLVCVCEYVWLFERIGRLNRTVFTNNIQRYAGYVYQHCGQRTDKNSQHMFSIVFSSIQVYVLHIASQSYHPVSFRDDFFPSLRDGRWLAGILQGSGWFPESSMRSIRTRFMRIAMRNMYVKIYKCM
jgi:hypothetical protein